MSTFTVYPAIDLRAGQVVRLQEGDPNRQTRYSDEPAKTARRWLEAGAEWLHVVNLDGAFDENDTSNQAALRLILDTAHRFKARVQFGGGIRSMSMIKRVLGLGANRLVLGTIAVERPQLVGDALKEFGADKIAVGIDARDGMVRLHGWQSKSEVQTIHLALQMRSLGVRTIVFTDISRDGLGSGLNIASTRALADASGLDVIASGGVHTLEDVIAARDASLAGVIIGRALYEGTIDLKEALRLTNYEAHTGTPGENLLA
jgi:phosphoribosylformimino-5-aminoimidazole carboxamide ribotide isomerase